jgi:23S rRNA (adenine2030-N6)-methyltransferase
MHVLRALHGRHERPLPQLRRRTPTPAATQTVNYRHAYHAGNFADVIKHVALVAILLHLRKKEKPFRVIDTHAGAGLYDLGSDAATRTGEAVEGIARLSDLAGASLPAALSTYLDIVRNTGPGRYPGSPLIAAQLLRANDKLTAIEKHPEEEGALATALAPFRNAKAVRADGYARLAALLPPPERRGLVLIDPPFEAEDEFAKIAEALASARKRFATGIYLVWYPIKSQAASDALSGEIRAGGAQAVARITIDVGRAPREDKERLSAAGLLVVNPPYGLVEEMRAASESLAPRLGRTDGAPARLLVAGTVDL